MTKHSPNFGCPTATRVRWRPRCGPMTSAGLSRSGNGRSGSASASAATVIFPRGRPSPIVMQNRSTFAYASAGDPTRAVRHHRRVKNSMFFSTPARDGAHPGRTLAGQVRPDRLAVPAYMAGHRRVRPPPRLQRCDLHVFLWPQHRGRAPPPRRCGLGRPPASVGAHPSRMDAQRWGASASRSGKFRVSVVNGAVGVGSDESDLLADDHDDAAVGGPALHPHWLERGSRWGPSLVSPHGARRPGLSLRAPLPGQRADRSRRRLPAVVQPGLTPAREL
jgi:hypothetical protein